MGSLRCCCYKYWENSFATFAEGVGSKRALKNCTVSNHKMPAGAPRPLLLF